MERDVEAATSYHELLVPALMEEWAPRVAEVALVDRVAGATARMAAAHGRRDPG